MNSRQYSNKEFWNKYWEEEKRDKYEFIFSHEIDKYLEWNNISNYMEIGGAPGDIMAYMSKEHNIDVSTVDFCNESILLNQLSNKGISRFHIYNEDFSTFDLSDFKERYDLVASWGFVEHFSLEESDMYIQKQKQMVSKNGYLIVELPNIRGVNWLIYRVFNNELLKIHNIKTMDLGFIRDAINRDNEFNILYGNYYLTSFMEFSSSNEFFDRHSIIRELFCFGKRLSRLLHINNIPNKFFSPYILFIARRIDE